jgi:hypothetical protein
MPQDLEILRLILEVAERAKEVQRQVKSGWPLEVAHVLLHELYRQALTCRRRPCSCQIACGAVYARHLEATARKLQGVAARATAQIEHGGALGGMEQGKNLLGFAHGQLTGAKLGEEKALQTLPEGVVFKPGRHAYVSVKDPESG